MIKVQSTVPTHGWYYNKGLRNKGEVQDRGYSKPNSGSNTFPPITCRRRGQEGHIARGCRNNLDASGKPLNSQNN